MNNDNETGSNGNDPEDQVTDEDLKTKTDEQKEELNNENTSESEVKAEDKEADIESKEEEEKDEEEEEVELVEIPKRRLEELESAEERALEEIKRERAESINYRKRLQKQRDEFAEYASVRVLTKLLAVQDDLKRIIDNAKDTIPDEHMEGIEMLNQRVEGIFESEGVTLIKINEGETTYDPKIHEAVVAQPIPDVAPNTIVGVISQGFKKGDRVLRPAKVMISKKPPEDKKEESPDEDQQVSEEDPGKIKEEVKETQ